MLNRYSQDKNRLAVTVVVVVIVVVYLTTFFSNLDYIAQVLKLWEPPGGDVGPLGRGIFLCE
jgi:hypothetical protein